MMRSEKGSVLLEGMIAATLSLALAVGSLHVLWRSFGQHLSVYRLSLQAHQSLTRYDDEVKLSASAQDKKNAVVLFR